MKGLLYCKSNKPYILSSHYLESELYYYTDRADEKETLMGILYHNHVKEFAPMYDKVGWR